MSTRSNLCSDPESNPSRGCPSRMLTENAKRCLGKRLLDASHTLLTTGMNNIACARLTNICFQLK